MVNSNRHRHMLFGDEFELYMKRFLILIEKDRNILSTVDEKQKKKGVFSPAIRFLIKNYVDKNWPEYVKKNKPNEPPQQTS